jgi:hypothetical protein
VPTKERRQKAAARLAGSSPDVRAFLHIVNDGRFTFPHQYDSSRHVRSIGGNAGMPVRSARVLIELPFDPQQHQLHAAVAAVVNKIADRLVDYANSQQAIPRDFYRDLTYIQDWPISGPFSLSPEHTRMLVWDENAPLDPNRVQDAALTALNTVIDAAEELAVTGAYRCLRRCQLESCRRLLFTENSDSRLYCADRRCRQIAHRHVR